jgi:fatty-acyl-CoA synthase
MQSTMQDVPLSLAMLLRHGLDNYSTSKVVTWTGESGRTSTFAEVGELAGRLANALRRLGVGPGERAGTFQWNNAEHLAAYLGVPASGSVLHTLNIRLFPEQLAYTANHAEDKVLICDASIVQVLAKVLPEMKTVEHVLVVGGDESTRDQLSGGSAQIHDFSEVVDAEEPSFAWDDTIDERAAAAMCYTSGTTGNPKGVVYSHRSTFLHAMAGCMGSAFGISDRDRLLSIVPMFHANGWGMPYQGWLAGADLLMPDRFLQPEPLAKFIEQERPTFSGAVPTVFNDLLRYIDEHETDVSSLQTVVCGGAAVPLSLMQKYQERHNIKIVQAWGMTETSPLAAIAHPPADAADDDWSWRSKTGRIFPAVECRVADDSGAILPNDGKSVGEFEIRGPWITGSYYQGDDPSKFSDDGWLRTGDVGFLDDKGFMQISDRSKDVIKSGGEWISSVDLENALMGHPDVVEAAVVAVPDERWSERPLASVVLRDGASVDADELREFLGKSVAKWQLPERWAFIESVPKTSVGKFDKKVLRSQYAEGDLEIVELESKVK